MESAQKDLLGTLLKKLFDAGILSQSTYSGAVDLVYSIIDIPELLQYRVCLTKEVSTHEHSQDSQ